MLHVLRSDGDYQYKIVKEDEGVFLTNLPHLVNTVDSSTLLSPSIAYSLVSINTRVRKKTSQIAGKTRLCTRPSNKSQGRLK